MTTPSRMNLAAPLEKADKTGAWRPLQRPQYEVHISGGLPRTLILGGTNNSRLVGKPHWRILPAFAGLQLFKSLGMQFPRKASAALPPLLTMPVAMSYSLTSQCRKLSSHANDKPEILFSLGSQAIKNVPSFLLGRLGNQMHGKLRCRCRCRRHQLHLLSQLHWIPGRSLDSDPLLNPLLALFSQPTFYNLSTFFVFS